MAANKYSNERESIHEHDVRRVGMLFRLAPRSVVITILIAGLTTAILWGDADHTTLGVWFAATVLISLGRLALTHAYHRSARDSGSAATRPLAWENAAATGAALMGLAWAGLALIGPLPPVSQAFTLFVLGGMSLGSAGILGASVRAFACFNVPLIAAQVGELIYMGGALNNTMGAMVVVFSGGLVASFMEFRSALLESIRSQLGIEQTNHEQRLIFESVTAGVAFIRDRTIVDYNPQFAKLLGYEGDELIGSPTRIYYSDEAKWNEIGKEGYAALRRGEAFNQEYDFRTKSGGIITCDATMQSIVPGNPDRGIVAILNDITLLKEREFALRTALLQQLAIFSNAPVGIIFVRNRVVEDCNDFMARMLQAPIEDIVGQTTQKWYAIGEQWLTRGAEIQQAFARGESITFTEHLRRDDGSRFWCRVRGGVVDPDNAANSPSVFVMIDVTEQMRAESALRESREQMALVIRASQSGIWDYNMVTREISFSPRFYEIIGMPASTVADEVMPIMDRVHPAEHKQVKAAFYSHVARRTSINETFRLRHADGSWVWVRGQGQAQWDESGRATRFVGSITDITEKRRQEEEIRRLALEDPLTCLPNRRLFEDRLERAVSAAARNREQVAVLLIDLDGFKGVNDEYGHAAGDAVLKTIAQRLTGCMRESDTVARTGGDEFVLLVRAINKTEDIAALAEKLLASIHQPIRDGELVLQVGASIGIAIYPIDTLHPAQLVRLADKAMYDVKQSGRNGYRLASGLGNEATTI
ncbi:MAG: diguanylate cyclase [Betaproteobacteria bacterium]|nr:diguanylate cyclase [Betaproteobacteria bacterium]